MSLRARLMIIGVTGVAVALIMGGLAFYGALTLAVNRTLDNEALAAAKDVAALVNEDRLPDPVPVSGAQVIQVVDAAQRVIGGSVTADRLTPLLAPEELQQALDGEAITVDGVRIGVAEPLRVRAVRAGSAAAPVSVIAAVSIGDVLATRTALRNASVDHLPGAARSTGGGGLAGDRLDAAPGRAAAGRGGTDQRYAGPAGGSWAPNDCRYRRPRTRSGRWRSP